MKVFKFDWFRSEERKQLDELKVEEQMIKNALLEKKLEDTYEVPYKKLIYSNGNLTVVLPFGVVINQKGVSSETYRDVKNAKDEEEIRLLLSPSEVKLPVAQYDEEVIKLVETGVNILRQNPDFEFKQGLVYLKGVNLQLPPEVVASFVELEEKIQLVGGFGVNPEELLVLDEYYQSLKMFWLKLATSPSKESREQVMKFCRENDIRISKRGNIIAYRRIVTWDIQDKKLNKFVEEIYTKIKGWKKSPANYWVGKNEDGVFGYFPVSSGNMDGWETMGNLHDLKDAKPDQEVVYTSKHNSGKYVFKIGDVYKAVDGDINTNAGLCAAGGLHFASVNYNYGGFGDVPVVVLVNPAKTITIPTNERQKGRTTEMKIACINPNDHGVHIEDRYIDKADEEYNEFTTQQLEEALKNKDFSEMCVVDKVPEINLVDLANITKALRERIVNV